MRLAPYHRHMNVGNGARAPHVILNAGFAE